MKTIKSHNFKERALSIFVFLFAGGCNDCLPHLMHKLPTKTNEMPLTFRTRPAIAWNSKYVVELQMEASRQTLDISDAKDRSHKELLALTALIRENLSPQEMEKLVESFDTLPYSTDDAWPPSLFTSMLFICEGPPPPQRPTCKAPIDLLSQGRFCACGH